MDVDHMSPLPPSNDFPNWKVLQVDLPDEAMDVDDNSPLPSSNVVANRRDLQMDLPDEAMDVDQNSPLPSSNDVPNWTDLPMDILDEISRRLNLEDYISFRLTCKNWNQAPSTSAFSACNSLSRMLLIFDDKDGSCFIYNLSDAPVQDQKKNLPCTILNLPELANSTVLAGTVGWILVKHMDGGRVFLMKPFSSTPTIGLPPLLDSVKAWNTFCYGVIKGKPFEENFKVIVSCFHGKLMITATWVPGDDSWQYTEFTLPRKPRSFEQPVYIKMDDEDWIGSIKTVFKQFVIDTRKEGDEDEIRNVMSWRREEETLELIVDFTGLLFRESRGILWNCSGRYCLLFSGDGRVQMRQVICNKFLASINAGIV